VTNNHVVQNAESVQVTTDDGKTYTAKVIGTDPRTDLALIKVDGKDFPYVKLADKRAARRRLGARGRQSVRARRHRDRRHRLGSRPRYRRRPL
jgi:S1-C subfamily serine protease